MKELNPQIEEQRKTIRSNFASTSHDNKPNRPFIIKSLRVDSSCFIFHFIEMTSPPYKKEKKLRLGPKAVFTVTGNGVFTREKLTASYSQTSLKEPQYIQSEKIGFSKPQAATLGSPTYFPSIFFPGEGNRALVGVILSVTNCLYSDRLYTSDAGTVGRRYDFNSKKQAQDYFDKKQARQALFPKEQIVAFINQISKNGSFFHNEILARLKWSLDENSKVFIGNDDLSSRLWAQGLAFIIKHHFMVHNLCDINYQVPIVFYCKNLEKFMTYTDLEQSLDRELANEIFEKKYNENDLTYLLDHSYLLINLDSEVIESLLVTKEWMTLISGLVARKMTHIMQIMQNRLSPESKRIFLSHLSSCINSYSASENILFLMDSYAKNYPSFTEPLIEHLSKEEIDLIPVKDPKHDSMLISSFFYRSVTSNTIKQLINKFTIKWDSTDNHGNNLLMLAISHENEDLAIELIPYMIPLLNHQNNRGVNALLLSLQHSQRNVIKALLAAQPSLSCTEIIASVELSNFILMNLEVAHLFLTFRKALFWEMVENCKCLHLDAYKPLVAYLLDNLNSHQELGNYKNLQKVVFKFYPNHLIELFNKGKITLDQCLNGKSFLNMALSECTNWTSEWRSLFTSPHFICTSSMIGYLIDTTNLSLVLSLHRNYKHFCESLIPHFENEFNRLLDAIKLNNTSMEHITNSVEHYFSEVALKLKLNVHLLLPYLPEMIYILVQKNTIKMNACLVDFFKDRPGIIEEKELEKFYLESRWTKGNPFYDYITPLLENQVCLNKPQANRLLKFGKIYQEIRSEEYPSFYIMQMGDHLIKPSFFTQFKLSNETLEFYSLFYKTYAFFEDYLNSFTQFLENMAKKEHLTMMEENILLVCTKDKQALKVAPVEPSKCSIM